MSHISTQNSARRFSVQHDLSSSSLYRKLRVYFARPPCCFYIPQELP